MFNGCQAYPYATNQLTEREIKLLNFLFKKLNRASRYTAEFEILEKLTYYILYK